MKIHLTILSLLLPFLSRSQANVELCVVDDSTHEPLPYATVHFTNKNEGFYCDKQGKLKLSAAIGDTIVVTYTGYVEGKVTKFPETTLVVRLQRKTYSLPEFIVKTYHEKGKPKEVGYHKKPKSFFMGSQMMLEFAVKLELPDDTTQYKIHEIILPIRRMNNINRLRIHLYSMNENGLPGDELLKSDITLTDENSDEMKKNGRFDVSGQNIIVSSKYVFVGVEWITEIKASRVYMGPSVKFTDAVKEPYTYYRTTKYYNDKWQTNVYISPYIKKGYSENLVAGLKIQAIR